MLCAECLVEHRRQSECTTMKTKSASCSKLMWVRPALREPLAVSCPETEPANNTSAASGTCVYGGLLSCSTACQHLTGDLLLGWTSASRNATGLSGSSKAPNAMQL
jgi:hypothetical protein